MPWAPGTYSWRPLLPRWKLEEVWIPAREIRTTKDTGRERSDECVAARWGRRPSHCRGAFTVRACLAPQTVRDFSASSVILRFEYGCKKWGLVGAFACAARISERTLSKTPLRIRQCALSCKYFIRTVATEAPPGTAYFTSRLCHRWQYFPSLFPALRRNHWPT